MKTHKGNTRPILWRIQRIIEELAHRPSNAKRLASLLEVSTKSVYRDLEFIRNAFGVEVTWVPRRGVFRLERQLKLFDW